MNRNIWMLLVLSLGLVACESKKEAQDDVSNQPEQQAQNGRGQLRDFPTFNTKTLVTIKGQVVHVARTSNLDQPGYEIQIILRTEEGDIPVQLGPGWFVEGGTVQILPLDEVEVKGSRLFMNGRIFVVATEIIDGGYTLKLRDDNGNPLWSGWQKK